ncbi:MAG: RluA family pseudouridine synthase [Chloroflexi bacterium]|nr:RluA family pseudouridine synthase [Chloroflexota bacterium]
MVINKPAGMVVHPAPGHPSHTLVNAIVGRWVAGSTSESLRPGIVHRLDKDTSGLIVIARNEQAQANLAKQFKERTMLKQYLVLVRCKFPSKRSIIDALISRNVRNRKLMAVARTGREARTRFRALEEFQSHTLVEATLETGRTHQLRVYFRAIGYPVVGNRVDGVVEKDLPLKRKFVHSRRLSLHLPATGEWREFQSDVPADLQETLEVLRNRSTA